MGMDEDNQPNRQAVLTISLLFSFNLKKSSNLGAISLHNRDITADLPYLGLLIHSETRSKSLMNTLHNLGMCIWYKRVIKISPDIANSVV